MVNCFLVGSMSDDEVGEMISSAHPSLLAKENRQDLLHSILRSPCWTVQEKKTVAFSLSPGREREIQVGDRK